MAVALAASHLRARRGPGLPGFPGAAAGLLLLTVGFFACYERTMEWPYWSVRDVVDLNWFSAPGAWELAPAGT
jgi:hypothetical protein